MKNLYCYMQLLNFSSINNFIAWCSCTRSRYIFISHALFTFQHYNRISFLSYFECHKVRSLMCWFGHCRSLCLSVCLPCLSICLSVDESFSAVHVRISLRLLLLRFALLQTRCCYWWVNEIFLFNKKKEEKSRTKWDFHKK